MEVEHGPPQDHRVPLQAGGELHFHSDPFPLVRRSSSASLNPRTRSARARERAARVARQAGRGGVPRPRAGPRTVRPPAGRSRSVGSEEHVGKRRVSRSLSHFGGAGGFAQEATGKMPTLMCWSLAEKVELGSRGIVDGLLEHGELYL